MEKISYFNHYLPVEITFTINITEKTNSKNINIALHFISLTERIAIQKFKLLKELEYLFYFL